MSGSAGIIGSVDLNAPDSLGVGEAVSGTANSIFGTGGFLDNLLHPDKQQNMQQDALDAQSQTALGLNAQTLTAQEQMHKETQTTILLSAIVFGVACVAIAVMHSFN